MMPLFNCKIDLEILYIYNDVTFAIPKSKIQDMILFLKVRNQTNKLILNH